MPSRSISVVESDKLFFFSVAELCCVCVPHTVHDVFCVQSYTDRHLSGFHILAIIKDAAVNIGIHLSF